MTGCWVPKFEPGNPSQPRNRRIPGRSQIGILAGFAAAQFLDFCARSRIAVREDGVSAIPD